MSRENPFAAAGKGAVTGLIGTAALTVALKGGAALLVPRGLLPEAPTPARDDPDVDPKGRLARKVAGGAFGISPDRDDLSQAAQGIQSTYGTGWGAAYDLVQNQLCWPALLGGVALGMVTTTVAPTLLPAIGISKPSTQQPLPNIGFLMGVHLLYGVVSALIFAALSTDD